MRALPLALALAALAAALACLVQGQAACAPADGPRPRRPDNATCSACRWRSEVQQFNLELIRQHVLAKLGFAHPPNITGRVMPTVADAVYEEYRKGQQLRTAAQDDYGMVSDQPARFYRDHDDAYHARTDKVYAFPR